MEQNALPNAGLHDQRKFLQFVQDHIGKVNGNKSAVTVWGESAGAGSILHHLVADEKPLFQKATLQSPAFQWNWDRNGTLNSTYTLFSKFAGCDDGNLECLQEASEDQLVNANQELAQSKLACQGLFPVGPSVDGKFIKSLPATALKSGNFNSDLESIIVSHVADEVPANSPFVPAEIRNDPIPATFDKFLNAFIPQPKLAKEKARINETYSSKRFRYNQTVRAATLIRDSSFTCNTRQLFNAFQKKNVPTYMMNYHFGALFGAAKHGADVVPTFSTAAMNLSDVLVTCANLTVREANIVAHRIQDSFGPGYKSYLISHALYGNPNTAAIKDAARTTWRTATTWGLDKHDRVRRVMKPIFGLVRSFEVGTDDINTASSCNFWDEMAEKITEKFKPQQEQQDQRPQLSVQELKP